MTKSEGLLPHLKNKAKSIEQLIHKFDKSIEICNLDCDRTLCQDICPFKEAYFFDCQEVEEAVLGVVAKIQERIFVMENKMKPKWNEIQQLKWVLALLGDEKQ